MKTYNFFYPLLVCLIFSGCVKSGTGPDIDEKKDPGVEADYTLLLSSDGMLSAQALNATAESITLNPVESPFAAMALPELTFREGSVLSLYHRLGDCSGEITKYNFDDQTSEKLQVFTDLGDCSLSVTALAHSETELFIGYAKEVAVKDTDYFVRIVNIQTSEPTFVDIALDKKPVQLALANNRLFILTFDAEITDENGLTVMDLDTNALIHEMNLGYNAKQIFKNIDGNLIISYDELHTVLNSTTLSVQYTSYEPGKEPKFSNCSINYLDDTGKLYYQRPTGEDLHPNIPAIYDFSLNTVYLYIYENFLTTTQIAFEFEIGDTTMVGYDEANNLILIGYQKTGGTSKGGLLRVRPIPEPAFIDNIDLDGVPYSIFVK